MDEHKLLRDIERLLKREIPRIALPGYEPDPTIKAEPIINGRQGGGRARRAATAVASVPVTAAVSAAVTPTAASVKTVATVTATLARRVTASAVPARRPRVARATANRPNKPDCAKASRLYGRLFLPGGTAFSY